MSQYAIINREGLFFNEQASFGPSEGAWIYRNLGDARNECGFSDGETVVRVQVTVVVVETVGEDDSGQKP